VKDAAPRPNTIYSRHARARISPIGVAFLGESLSPTAWIGLGCVVIGVAAMTIPARKMTPISEVG
jgi:multidrug transporter EmrE-like cation transporter